MEMALEVGAAGLETPRSRFVSGKSIGSDLGSAGTAHAQKRSKKSWSATERTTSIVVIVECRRCVERRLPRTGESSYE